MGNIVVLSGSPRKNGNTDLLVQAFAEGASTKHHVDVLPVAAMNIAPCQGCNTCCSREGHACYQQDDMYMIYEKLKSADTVVLASPVYFYGISAQLKAVVDRLHTPMRNEFPVHQLVLILVGAAELPELFNAIKEQYHLILNFFGLNDAGMVLIRGAKEKGDVVQTDGLHQAYMLGCSIE